MTPSNPEMAARLAVAFGRGLTFEQTRMLLSVIDKMRAPPRTEFERIDREYLAFHRRPRVAQLTVYHDPLDGYPAMTFFDDGPLE